MNYLVKTYTALLQHSAIKFGIVGIINTLLSLTIIFSLKAWWEFGDVAANFTGYIEGGWDMNDQIRLKEVCDRLNRKGVKFLLSNSSVDFLKELYKDYRIEIVKANRSINSDGQKRGEVEELLIRNYE